MKTRWIASICLVSVMVVCSVGCGLWSRSEKLEADGSGARAIAEIMSKSGSSVVGIAVFTANDNDIALVIEIENVSSGLHAVHIHKTGDCCSDDAKSAGGHWNPTDEPHGKWGVPPFHSGDIGNINVGSDGVGRLLELATKDRWSIGGSPETNILGKAIIVHAGEDDFKSQPSGDAGKRVGCGVIALEQ